MRNVFLFTLGLSVSLGVNAATQSFSENENITLELSKSKYNRIFVANDVIKKAHFIKEDLELEYDPDGSVFVNLLTTDPITVFFKTKQGHHFSVTVKSVDELGQTIELVPRTASVKARQFEHKSPYEETVTKLIQAMMNQQVPTGYGMKSVFSSYKPFNKALSIKVAKQYVGDAYIGEIVTVYNRSAQPVKLDETWFKTTDTRAIALSGQTVAPKQSETLFIVKEKAHV